MAELKKLKAGRVYLCWVAPNFAIPYGGWRSVCLWLISTKNCFHLHFCPAAFIRTSLLMKINYCVLLARTCCVAMATWRHAGIRPARQQAEAARHGGRSSASPGGWSAWGGCLQRRWRHAPDDVTRIWWRHASMTSRDWCSAGTFCVRPVLRLPTRTRRDRTQSSSSFFAESTCRVRQQSDTLCLVYVVLMCT